MIPDFAAVERAAERIAPYIASTPVLHSSSIDSMAGAELHFKCESFQRIGAFKFRGASNAVWSLCDSDARNGVVTHSSGNHGAALALAARTRGIAAHVIVPDGAVPSKVAAIAALGATVHRCAPTQAAREAMADEIARSTGATMIHPYTNLDVIAGQGTAALELIRGHGPFDAIVAPIGGGGLLCGTAIVTRSLLPNASVHGAEPSGADDAARSLAAGKRIDDFAPDTICDGLRALLGEINFVLLQQMKVAVLTVTDAETISAMRLIFERLKVVVEPSCATVLAAVLKHRDLFVGKRVGLILSGGNADLDHLPWQS